MKKCMLSLVMAMLIGCASAPTLQQNVSSDGIGVIVVDIQGDFTEWKNGSLAVKGTDLSYVEKVKAATRALHEKGYLIFATQDSHPPDHISFYSNHPEKKPFDVVRVDGRTQVCWPPHCIAGTENAEVLLDPGLFTAVVKKGQDKNFDSYSGFRDDGGAETGMDRILRRHGITKLFVYGVATDYCVKATAVDAAKAGYDVSMVLDLSRGVSPESTAAAVKEMKEIGITIVPTLE